MIGGLGYGNVSYTLDNKAGKPDFPALFEEPDHDGSLTDWGFMAKPEIYFSYVMPISRESVFDVVYSFHTGYELPFSRFELADLNMKKYMGGPYMQVAVGIRP